MMTGRMAAKRSEWDGERARRVFEEANARYEASKHIGARFRGTRTDVRFWHKADIADHGVMVIFNDPVPVENPALQAVLMALYMRTAIEALMAKWRLLGHDLGFGIGIAHGFATLGTIGFEGRRDYAAIGTVSNVASRLCDEAKTGQILISPRVLLAVDKAVIFEPVGEFALKGLRRPMMTYNVLSSSPAKPD